MTPSRFAAWFSFSCVLAALAFGSPTSAAVEIFRDHGVATPISNQRGTIATRDAAGHNLVATWLMDHRGGYGLLLIDVTTGKAEQFDLPFPVPGESVNCPYAWLLSSRNRFYTAFGDHFVEFDLEQRRFTACHAFARASDGKSPQFGMGMTEDDEGRIWTVVYPQSRLLSFDPKSGAFRDFGEVHQENWSQYQRFVAADDTGWIYFALGLTKSQIVAFDPQTGKATPLLGETERQKGSAYLYRDLDGKVYGQALREATAEWYELYRGAIRKVGQRPAVQTGAVAENITTLGHARTVSDDEKRAKRIITGDQGMTHARFPDGRMIKECNLTERKLVVFSADGKDTVTIAFDYRTDGALIMAVANLPDGTVGGGTTFPDRFFSFNPRTEAWVRRKALGQWNTVASQGGHLFAGGYGGGFLLEWDPQKPWVDTIKNSTATNPAYLTDCTPVIHRPAVLHPLPDGHTIAMGGTPGYGYTGGGLLLWDRQANTRTLIEDKDLIPEQSTASLVSLPEGKLLGATTTLAGTGGEKKASAPELYILDVASKKLEWRAALLPAGTQEIVDLQPGRDGLVYGVADRNTFFVFDPKKRAIAHRHDFSAEFGGATYQQGARILISDDAGQLYLLVRRGVLRLDSATWALKLVAESPMPVDAGGTYFQGRIYFASGSHLCSLAVPE